MFNPDNYTDRELAFIGVFATYALILVLGALITPRNQNTEHDDP